MEMPVAPNSRINSICRVVAAATVPFSCVSRREIQFNNKNCSHCGTTRDRGESERRGKNRASKKNKNISRSSLFFSSILSSSLFLSPAVGLSRPTENARYAFISKTLESPVIQLGKDARITANPTFSDSRLFLGTILGGCRSLPSFFLD